MPLIAKSKGGGNLPLVPEDQHKGRCVLIVDIGTQESSYGYKHQCVIGWELPEVLQVYDAAEGEQPAMLSRFFTVSLSEKANLRGVLEQWRGRAFSDAELDGFDLEKLAGVPCLLQVIHKQGQDNTVRALINNVSKLPKGLVCPPQVIPTRIFTLDTAQQEDFAALPDWIREQVKQSAEYADWVRKMNGSAAQGSPADTTFASDIPPDDEVPF